MMSIEQLGPYTVERKGICGIDVSGNVEFSATLSFAEYTGYPIPVTKTGNKYALTAMALTESMELTLKAQGFDDVVVRNNIESIEGTKETEKS